MIYMVEQAHSLKDIPQGHRAVPPGDVLEAGGLLHHVNHVPYVPIYLVYSLGLVWYG